MHFEAVILTILIIQSAGLITIIFYLVRESKNKNISDFDIQDFIDDEIKTISKRINADPGHHCTAEPAFAVLETINIHGIDFEYGDKYMYRHDDYDDLYTVEQAMAECGVSSEDDLPDGWEKSYYLETERCLTMCFTEEAASDFIASNSHRYGPMEVFVDSAYRNHEWQAVRNFLKSLTEKDEENRT